LLGILSKVPDVAVLVLRKPVERALREVTVEGDRVEHLHAGHAEDELGVVRHGHLVVLESRGRVPLVDVGGPRRQGIIWVVDGGDEVRRVDRRAVRGRPESRAGVDAERTLLAASLAGVVRVIRGLGTSGLHGACIREIVALTYRQGLVALRTGGTGAVGRVGAGAAGIEWFRGTHGGQHPIAAITNTRGQNAAFSWDDIGSLLRMRSCQSCRSNLPLRPVPRLSDEGQLK